MKNKYVGFTQGFHTDSLAIIDENGDCDFYPKGFDPSIVDTDNIAFFEKPWLKKTRQFYAGQYRTALKPLRLKLKPKHYFHHHQCHAANAFQQSEYSSANIIVADSIGEWDTLSIWSASYNRYGEAQYDKLYSRKYPFSLGLFYSSITQLVGLKPNAEENKLMELSEKGEHYRHLYMLMFQQLHYMNNHRGCLGMYPDYAKKDIAHNAQRILEETVQGHIYQYCDTSFSFHTKPICFSGGVAFNKLLVDNIRKMDYNVYVPSNPGDPGSAIGAAALLYKKRIKSVKVHD